ncbi:hypothetical protein ACFU99_11090 [Streptomyces sp. NPDC057654]|uniref:hypothetical protein n=1 Tax=Streptomyces sp. NPDC057654 TaxID=3346196 RepID=UPI0036CAC92A
MQLDIRQEAGPDHDVLGERLRGIAELTAPLVEAVTELPLPERTTVRLVSTATWRRNYHQYQLGLYNRERGSLSGRLREQFLPYLRETMAGRLNGTPSDTWTRTWAMCIEDAMGEPETLVLAENIQHKTATDDELHQLLAHELTHLAQYHASPEMFDFARTPLTRSWGEDLWAVESLLEGHAQWAASRITHQTQGPHLTRTDEGIDSCRQATESTETDKRARLESYTAATAFIEGAIDKIGLGNFNSVREELSLCPIERELDSLSDYLLRIDGLLR